MKTKTFDAVDMKRRGAERIYDETKGMTIEQELEYWRQRDEELRQHQELVRSKVSKRSEDPVSHPH